MCNKKRFKIFLNLKKNRDLIVHGLVVVNGKKTTIFDSSTSHTSLSLLTRHDINSQFNKSEAIHALRCFLFFSNEGKIRQNQDEGYHHDSSVNIL
ncbi:MAG: hypothetical protein E4G94_04350 [ANME-2 cluster archaeon]|nr:MAG: hypothetical protein E4G94_04350 [ANME-2 cluster archaeon]